MERSRTASLRGAQRRGNPWIASLALAMTILFSVPANAAETSGFFSSAYLQELCASDTMGREIVKNGHTACQSYISGVVDYHKLLKSLGVAPVIDICVPNTVPMRRLQSIVWVYLKKHGEHSEFVAAPAVTLALSAYYPCKKPSRKSKR